MRNVALLSMLLLTGCGAAVAKTWVGHNEAELYAKWGAPVRSQAMAGGKVISFDNRNYSGRVVCETSFIVASTGTVTSSRSTCP